jgi:phospholipid:diacylglycerol acyltransferase
MMLDPVTGLDPPNAKVRAAEGIDAASTFIQGYWLWLVCLPLIQYEVLLMT